MTHTCCADQGAACETPGERYALSPRSGLVRPVRWCACLALGATDATADASAQFVWHAWPGLVGLLVPRLLMWPQQQRSPTLRPFLVFLMPKPAVCPVLAGPHKRMASSCVRSSSLSSIPCHTFKPCSTAPARVLPVILCVDRCTLRAVDTTCLRPHVAPLSATGLLHRTGFAAL